MNYLIIVWTFASLIISNHFVNDIKALLVSEKEFSIESFEQLIERNDFKILIEKKSNAYKIIEKVIFLLNIKYKQKINF
jgi:hypothetical protein